MSGLAAIAASRSAAELILGTVPGAPCRRSLGTPAVRRARRRSLRAARPRLCHVHRRRHGARDGGADQRPVRILGGNGRGAGARLDLPGTHDNPTTTATMAAPTIVIIQSSLVIASNGRRTALSPALGASPLFLGSINRTTSSITVAGITATPVIETAPSAANYVQAALHTLYGRRLPTPPATSW
jgi:hypothetical protein